MGVVVDAGTKPSMATVARAPPNRATVVDVFMIFLFFVSDPLFMYILLSLWYFHSKTQQERESFESAQRERSRACHCLVESIK